MQYVLLAKVAPSAIYRLHLQKWFHSHFAPLMMMTKTRLCLALDNLEQWLDWERVIE